MPEPISFFLGLGAAKLAAAHTAHAVTAHAVVAGTTAGGTASGVSAGHVAAWAFAGVAAGTTLYVICRCLKALVEAGIFSEKQAKSFKKKAQRADEKTQKQMKKDAIAMCEKYGVSY